MSDWESVPAYVRVLTDLRRKIETGEIPPGEAIPSVADAVELYSVSATTVQKAVRALKAAGLVDTVPGKGVFVRRMRRRTSRSADYVTPVPDGAPINHGRSSKPEVGGIIPPDDVAEKLGLDPGEIVICRRRVMFDEDGSPTQIAISLFPMEIARGTELELPARLRGAVPAALKRIGYPPRFSREWVGARMPTSEEARILRITASGIPVMRVVRLTTSDFQRPVEALVIVLSAEIFDMEYDLRIEGE